MIACAIVVVIMIIVIVQLVKTRETYITLEEVIPQARILSQDEGIVEYKGIEYILGVHNLEKKKRLIESLDLLNIQGPCVVDLRFKTQVVIKQEPGLFNKTGSGNTQ
ncbi:MAG: hypothetical protein WBB37_05915 [bacterium]